VVISAFVKHPYGRTGLKAELLVSFKALRVEMQYFTSICTISSNTSAKAILIDPKGSYELPGRVIIES